MIATKISVTTELKKETTAAVIIICKVHQATGGRLPGRVITLEKMRSLGRQISITGQVTVKVICNPVLGGHPLLGAPILLTEVATVLVDLTKGKFMAITGLVGQGLPLNLWLPGSEATRQGHGVLRITRILGHGLLKDLGLPLGLGLLKGRKGSTDQARPRGKGLLTD